MIPRFKKNKGLTLVELVAVLTIIGLFMGVMMLFIYKTTIIGKETVLRVQLKNLRLTLDLHKIIRGSYPEDLKELLQARYKPQGSKEVFFSEKFLDTVGRDADGYPVDPFRKRFHYNPQEGVVTSVVKGYQNW
ncbi:MAG: type II secretion system protein [Candidatus Omnitrophota bacterium]|nr:type II secretion system protein [Candidatus Omnitrophota bacterium]